MVRRGVFGLLLLCLPSILGAVGDERAVGGNRDADRSLRLQSDEGVFVVYHAAVPLTERDARARYVGWWLGAGDEQVYVYPELLYAAGDSVGALIDLAEQFGVDLDPLTGDDPALRKRVIRELQRREAVRSGERGTDDPSRDRLPFTRSVKGEGADSKEWGIANGEGRITHPSREREGAEWHGPPESPLDEGGGDGAAQQDPPSELSPWSPSAPLDKGGGAQAAGGGGVGRMWIPATRDTVLALMGFRAAPDPQTGLISDDINYATATCWGDCPECYVNGPTRPRHRGDWSPGDVILRVLSSAACGGGSCLCCAYFTAGGEAVDSFTDGTGTVAACCGPGGACNDGNPCTENDRCANENVPNCAPGMCCGTPMCPDGPSVCTHEYCVSGMCVSVPLNCDDHSVCTADRCDAVLGCINDPTPCPDDGLVCTADGCDSQTGCYNRPQCSSVETPQCCPYGDGYICCGGTQTCCEGFPHCCDPGRECCGIGCCLPGRDCCNGQCQTGCEAYCCAWGWCEGECCNGGCCLLGQICCDGQCCGSVCNPGTCAGGQCVTTPACNDGRICTDNVCTEGLCGDFICTYPDNTAPCEDEGNPCTSDFCAGGQCTHPCDPECSGPCPPGAPVGWCEACACVPETCSIWVSDGEGCPGGTAELVVAGGCSPECTSSVTWQITSQSPYITGTVGSLVCAGKSVPASVSIDPAAPFGSYPITITGTTPLGATCMDDTATITVYLDATLDPDPTFIPARSEWQGIVGFAASEITVTWSPVGCEGTLEIVELVGDQGYVPPDQGELARLEVSKWVYRAFLESESELCPKPVNVKIAAKHLDTELTWVSVRVLPVHTWWTHTHQHYPGESAHQPDTYDFEQDFHYLIWKYANVLATTGGTFAGFRIDECVQCPDLYGPCVYACTNTANDFVAFGTTTFTGSENQAASIIGHELVHTTQIPSPIPDECGPYQWEANHTFDTGTTPCDTAYIQNVLQYLATRCP